MAVDAGAILEALSMAMAADRQHGFFGAVKRVAEGAADGNQQAPAAEAGMGQACESCESTELV